ncbi:MAG: DUF1800 domain-containing protein [Caldilineaceae bacterium]|nr:DUF1800 domain-containing protein [Caldilineaceae bacterium]
MDSPAKKRDTATVSRRDLLRGGAATAVITAAAVAETRSMYGQDAPDADTPLMRSARSVVRLLDDMPETPPVGVIALNRAAFGPRPGVLDYRYFAELGDSDDARLQAFVDQQLNPAGIDDSACENRIAAQGFTTLNKSLSQLWADHVVADVDWEERIRPARETEQAAWLRAVYSKRQLVEVLADFWHNHFNVYGFDYWSAPVWSHYDRQVIRANMLGNFRTFLGAVATHPAMLYFLDNTTNTSAGPNENFARELFELHTMGAENYLGVVEDRNDVPLDDQGRPVGYIDKDVYQATECFTGWTIDRDTGEFSFHENDHSRYEKIVLNTSIGDFLGQQDGEIVLDLLADHPGTARHIARKLCRRLISDEPPESVVQAAADVFHAQRDAPDQLKQVVRTILLSDEFRTTWGQKVKRPFEYSVAILRAGKAEFALNDSFRWNYGRMGQPLFQWQPPDGYPDNRSAWTGTMPILQRWKHCNWLAEWTYEDGPNEGDYRLRFEQEMPGDRTTPNQIVDFWSQRLLGRSLPAQERGSIVNFIAQGRNPDFALPADLVGERTRFTVALMMMAPSFLWR